MKNNRSIYRETNSDYLRQPSNLSVEYFLRDRKEVEKSLDYSEVPYEGNEKGTFYKNSKDFSISFKLSNENTVNIQPNTEQDNNNFYCPSCKSYVFTFARYKMYKPSLWESIICSCISNPQQCIGRYYCKVCSYRIAEIKYNYTN